MVEQLNRYIDEHFDQLVRDTQELVSVESTLDESTAGPGAPFGTGIQKALSLALKKGKDMGFNVRNYDGYAGYIQYGTSGEQAAILAHIDVVPAIGQWIVPPYSAQIVDNRLYGRGSVDDKGPLVACLYAMKAIQESGLPVRNHLRMILGTDEETLARGIYYYLDRDDPPAFGFSPDAEFPVIHAEKGTIRYLYHLPPADQDILSIHAGSRLNVVPDQAEARLAHISPEQVQALISSLNTRATSTARAEGSDTIVEVQGLASHACYPAEGINAIQALLLLIKKLYPAQDTPLKEALAGLSDLLQEETDGVSMGIACTDEVSGALTLNTAILTVDDTASQIKFDIRYPVTHDGNEILKQLEEIESKILAKYELIQHKPPLYVEKDRPFIKALQKAYQESTGQEPRCISIGGGTYCRYVKNTVSFGPVFPGQKELAHQTNEFIELEDLRKIAKIYAQAIYNLIG